MNSMRDRQALFAQLLDYLQASPPLPPYLQAAPETETSFDPYQMVSEWIALRQEMKQQGKLLQTAQERLHQELATVRTENEQLHQQLTQAQQQGMAPWAAELAAQEKQWSKDQEQLLRNLLNIMDALDRACSHWDEQMDQVSSQALSILPPPGWKATLAGWLNHLSQALVPQTPPAAPETDLLEVWQSDRQGIDLIRRNLLDMLKHYQVSPITALGQPFSAQTMYALGRQPNHAPASTVIQEVVRGYRWGDRVLREAQVIVSAGMADPPSI